MGERRLSLVDGAAAGFACFSVSVDEGGTGRYRVELKRETEPSGSLVPQDIDSPLTATTLPSIAAGRRLSKLMGTLYINTHIQKYIHAYTHTCLNRELKEVPSLFLLLTGFHFLRSVSAVFSLFNHMFILLGCLIDENIFGFFLSF